MEVNNRMLGRIIGKGGSKIRELQDDSGCRINIIKDRDNGTTTPVELTGSAEAQSKARDMIEDLMSSDFGGGRGGGGGYGGGRGGGGGGYGGGGGDPMEMEVPSSSVGKIIGKGGSKIRDLQEVSGARIKIDKERDNHVNAVVEIHGDSVSQAQAKRMIEELISEDSGY